MASDIRRLNSEDSAAPGYALPGNTYPGYQLIFVFPDVRVLGGYWAGVGYAGASIPAAALLTNVEISANTTTGVDGLWTSVTTSVDKTNTSSPFWRSHITSLPSLPANAIRFTFAYDVNMRYPRIHLYGVSQPGQLSNRLLAWHPTIDQRMPAAALDWGDVPRGSSEDRTFRVKNTSSLLTAITPSVSIDALNLQSPSVAGMYLVSSDGAAFASTLTLPTMAPGAISRVLTVRRSTPGTATLGLAGARLVLAAADWS